MDLQQISFKIKHLPAFLIGKYKKSGLKPGKDQRNFKIGSLWGRLFGDAYEPKHKRIINPTLSVKDQKNLNTCVYNGTIITKEPDEGVVLSVKSIVRYARRMGLLSGNGWSSADAGYKCLKNFGALEEKDLPDTGHENWESYSTGPIDFSKAEKHKIKSYWEYETRGQVLKALDEGRLLGCAMTWFSGFNQSGGFKAPWLITKPLGYSVGGHFIAIIGYDLNYYGERVYIIQNSYSAQWGDNGKFYVKMDYLDKFLFGFNSFGCFGHLDLDVDYGDFLIKYDGKNVKAFNSPGIYHIQKGTKKAYPDWPTFLAWDGNLRGFITLDEADSLLLNKIPDGDVMDIKKSIYWDVLSQNVNWGNLKSIKSADMNNELINALFKMQYNKNLGLPLDNNL